ncbi:MAG TPA: tetratricopeptide repeat protein [Chloroflexia bacterium]|nr:tetratricopeptide repeat protein [Chloroflexia bacterium]
MTGPGGVGKTRLALQVAEELLEEFPDGVYLIELAPIADPDLVIPTIAGVLQVSEAPGIPLIDTLNEQLQDKCSLLVLDNFEQILPAGSVLPELLAACPDLKLLVTSRSPMRLRAEREFAVSPLAIPEPKGPVSAARSAHFGAVALFIQRAGTAHPGFELTDANASAVIEVCRRVDGLPLAIELVAAHTRLLSPRSILARLTHPLHLLEGGPLDAPDRHQTMRDTIEWSYRLLSEGEQRLFRRLSVFVGGFSLRAAEAVCNEAGDITIEVDHPQAIEVLEGLEALVDKNLVRRLDQTEDKDSDARLGMLETVREYASEQLEESGEVEAVRRRHADYFIALAQEAQVGMETTGSDEMHWINWLSPDESNLRAALSWLFEQREPAASEDALRLLQAANKFWDRRAGLDEFLGWLEKGLAQVSPEARLLRNWALRKGSYLARMLSDYPKSRDWAERALAIARELDDKLQVAEALSALSQVVGTQGEYDSARSMMEEALEIYRELGDPFPIAGTLHNLGEMARYQGDHASAEHYYRESLERFTEQGSKSGVLFASTNLGHSLYHQGNREKVAEAKASLVKAVELAQELEGVRMVAEALTGLGGVILAELRLAGEAAGQDLEALQQAARLYGLASGLLERSGRHMIPATQADFDRNAAATRALLGDKAFNAAWDEGRAMAVDQALELATREYSHETEISKPRGRGRSRMRAVGGLTHREYEVAALVVRGMTNAEIARQLVLSVRTVDMHVANAMQKLGVRKRTELAAWAARQGLSSDPV